MLPLFMEVTHIMTALAVTVTIASSAVRPFGRPFKVTDKGGDRSISGARPIKGYKRLFPKTCIDPAKNTESEVRTTKRGFRLATSVGGALTGRGGRLIIVDDPIKPDDAASDLARRRVIDWYEKTLTSRLDNKSEGAIILVMQRLHVDDLAGHLLEAGGGITSVCLR